MIRSLKYILFLATTVAVVAACKKSINLNPVTTVNGDAFFQTVDDYDFALTAAYQRLKANGLYGGLNGGSVFLSSVDIAADNFFSGPTNLGNLNTVFRWNYTADNGVPPGRLE